MNGIEIFKTNKEQLQYTKNVHKILQHYVKEENEHKNISETITNPIDYLYVHHFMNSQKKSSVIEKFLANILNGSIISSSLDKGDIFVNNPPHQFKNIADSYIELKTSTFNKKGALNIRQIRLYQDINYYLCSYINELNPYDSSFYLLTKEQMVEEVHANPQFTHGTKNANNDKINPEYSLTIYMNTNNIKKKEWDDKYKYYALEKLFLSYIKDSFIQSIENK